MTAIGSLVDASIFPATASYLKTLPDGLKSWPECQTRREYNDIILKEFPDDAKHPGLNPVIQEAISFRNDKSGWVSDLHCLVHMHIVLDLHFKNQQEFFHRHFVWTQILTVDPFYRAAMYCISPKLTMIAASALWSRSSRGTQASTKEGPLPKSRYFTLSYPEGMYKRFNVEAVFVSAKAIITQPSGKNIRYEIVGIDASSATALFFW